MMPGDVVGKPCTSDYIEVFPPEGSGNFEIGKLCGDNTGQHIYIHFPDNTEEKSVKIKINPRKDSEYRIKIHQVSNSISLAEPARQTDRSTEIF